MTDSICIIFSFNTHHCFAPQQCRDTGTQPTNAATSPGRLEQSARGWKGPDGETFQTPEAAEKKSKNIRHIMSDFFMHRYFPLSYI